MERAINRNVVKRVALLCSLLLAFGTSYSQERLRPCQRYSGYESYQKMLTGYMVPEGNIEWLVLFMLGPERSICYNLSTHELVATSSREVICKDWFKGERSIQTVRVMFQFVCPKRDPHFKELSKLHVLFHTMNNTIHIFIN